MVQSIGPRPRCYIRNLASFLDTKIKVPGKVSGLNRTVGGREYAGGNKACIKVHLRPPPPLKLGKDNDK